MENNEIMERLLQDDKRTKSADKGASAKANKWDTAISRIRVVTAKYKVYIVLLLIFIALFWFNYIPSAKKDYNNSLTSYSQVNLQLTSLKREIEDAKADMDYLCNDTNWVVANEDSLRKCLNERSGCSSLPDTWRTWTGESTSYDLSIPLSYLQLHSLYNKKMPVDEKRVLKNLNEYLIKQDISWEDKRKVWDILRIEIWDPKAESAGDNHFFAVPVNVQIKFDTISDLTGFLYNIEKKLIENWEDRILYKVQTVSYDIVTNDEPQITDISMVAYYYHDENLKDKKECDNESEESYNSNNEEGVNSDESGSFFDNIFKSFKK